MARVEDFVMQNEDGEDVNCQAELRRIPVKAEGDFDNYFGNWYTTMDRGQFGGELKVGSIKNLALRYGIKALYTDEKSPGSGDLKRVKVEAGNPYGSMPDLRDDENGDSIAERLLKLLIGKHNRWMGQHERYQQVFRPYLDNEEDAVEDEEEAETRNPTPHTVTNISSSGSGLEESPTPSRQTSLETSTAQSPQQ